MNAVNKKWLWSGVAVAGVLTLSLLAWRGYMTPEMLIYFASFKWCF